MLCRSTDGFYQRMDESGRRGRLKLVPDRGMPVRGMGSQGGERKLPSIFLKGMLQRCQGGTRRAIPKNQLCGRWYRMLTAGKEWFLRPHTEWPSVPKCNIVEDSVGQGTARPVP